MPTPTNASGYPYVDPSKTDAKMTKVSVGVAATPILGGDPNRKAALFVNLSPNPIYIGFDATLTAGNGILLIPNGGAFNTADWEDYILTKQSFYAVSTVAASPLTVVNVTQFTI